MKTQLGIALVLFSLTAIATPPRPPSPRVPTPPRRTEKYEYREKRAEVPDTKNFNVRLNPVPLILGMVVGDIEVRVTSFMTLGPAGTFLKRTVSDVDLRAYSIGAHLTFYLSGDGAISSSWYVRPFYLEYFLTLSRSNDSAKLNASNVGFTAGYVWVSKAGVNLGVGLGAQYFSNDAQVRGSNGTVIDIPTFAGVLPAFDVTVGFAF